MTLPAVLAAIFVLGALAPVARSAGEPAPLLSVTASTVDGQTIAGKLLGLSTDGVTLAAEPAAGNPAGGSPAGGSPAGGSPAAGSAEVKLSAATLVSVAAVREQESKVDPPTLVVQVIDGSLLAATSFQAHDGMAEVRLTSGFAVSLPTGRIDWVRFRAPEGDDPLAAQWAEIVAGAAGDAGSAESPSRSGGPQAAAAAADVLVLRKKTALDYLEGVASRVTDDAIVFEVDHDPVTVKRSRIEGLIYYRAKKDDLADAAALVTVRGGTRLQVARLALAADRVQLATPAGVELSLPLADLARLDFSSANTQFLSDLEPESFEYVSYFGSKDQPASLAGFYKPRRDVAFDLNPLRLDGKTFAKGLSMHARTKVVYRLPGKFRRLTAVVGIDDSLRDAGDARLEIRGDGKMLWEAAVRGTEHAQLLDVSVAGVRRLEILADFGGDFDAGDVIDLGDVKVTR